MNTKFFSISHSRQLITLLTLSLFTILCAGCFTMVPQFRESPMTVMPQPLDVVLLLDSDWSNASYVGGPFGEKHTYLLGESLVKYATSAAQKSFRNVTVLNGKVPGTSPTGATVILRPSLTRVQTVESATTGGGQKVIFLVDWTITSQSDGRILWKSSIETEGDDRNGHGSIRARAREAFEDAYQQLFIKTVTALSSSNLGH